ncbi:MAG: hypothetical protein QXU99_05800 [Candidatus Bathyarchaeia archaeon]
MTQETVVKHDIPEISLKENQHEKRTPATIQELVSSLKSVADDIGQINELTAEEKLLVAEFFKSLLKLTQPFVTSIPVDTAVLPVEIGNVIQAYIDPTGHLALLFQDGHMELKNLSEEKNRDLMITIVEEITPKFKNLTSAQKRRIENRIKFLSAITKEMQRISDALSTVTSDEQA